MKIVPIDNIIDDPMLKIYKEGSIYVNLKLAVLTNPNIYMGIPDDIITLNNLEIDWNINDIKPEWHDIYLHLYIVEADAYRIAICMDDDPIDGIQMSRVQHGDEFGEITMPGHGYRAKEKSLVRWLTQTFDYKFDTHPWYYHRIDRIDMTTIPGKRIVRMV